MQQSTHVFNVIGEMVMNPVCMGATCIAYLLFVKWLGPKMMASRKPYDLKYIIVAYNAIQVIWNFYALTVGDCHYLRPIQCPNQKPIQATELERSLEPFRHPYVWASFASNCVRGEIVTFTSSDWPEYHMAWCYYISKFIDMLDTVFFVLRKKDKQISFLHVYHHALIVPSSWYYIAHVREPVYIPYTMINTTVHCIMYMYYMIAAMGPQYAKYVWWKIYITRFQMVQFFTVFTVLSCQLAYGCHITSGWAYYLIANNLLLIILFGNFYLQAYRREKKKVT